MNESSKMKMVFAVIYDDDYEAAVRALNKEGFYVTKLSSTGGFLKKKNSTIMIGIGENDLSRVLEILKDKAGRRMERSLIMPPMSDGAIHAGLSSSVPLDVEVGGAAVFVMDMDSMHKF